jgi:hypothetical protein
MKEAPGTCGEAPGAGGVMLRRETKPFPFESLFGRLSSQQTKSTQLLVSEYYLLTVAAFFQVTYSR